uniref:Methionine aminopeptidase n=1 Tax=Lutzomyia longipalpis TaxID=7200 RepID=A0A1B0CHN6_LUTLO
MKKDNCGKAQQQFEELHQISIAVILKIMLTSKRKDHGTFCPVSPGSVSPERLIPSHITAPPYYHTPQTPSSTMGEVEIKSVEVIAKMRESCKLAARILNECREVVQVGRTTDDIDEFVHEKLSKLLEDGDLINVDITVYHQGFHGDCSRTFLVGNVDDLGRKLAKVAEECLMLGIEACGPNRMFSRIGSCIESHARKHGFSVIPAFIGHGIGSYFHGPPEILHFKNSVGGFMKPGMVFTVEPVISTGGQEVEILEDGWTAVSCDGARSAQFEHTVLITDSNVEILTLPD